MISTVILWFHRFVQADFSVRKMIKLYSNQGFNIAFAHDGSFFVLSVVRFNPDREKYVQIHEKTGIWGGADETDLVAADENGRELWKINSFIKGRNENPSLRILENNDTEVELFNFKNKTKRFKIYDLAGHLIND